MRRGTIASFLAGALALFGVIEMVLLGNAIALFQAHPVVGWAIASIFMLGQLCEILAAMVVRARERQRGQALPRIFKSASR